MLNNRKIRFVEAYLDGNNMTESAVKAGYSRRTAYSQGSRLMKQDEVKGALQQRSSELSEKAFMSKDKYTREIYKRYLNEKAPNVKRSYLEMLGNMLGFNAGVGQQSPTIAIFAAIELAKQAKERLDVTELPQEIEAKIKAITDNTDGLPVKYQEILSNRLRKYEESKKKTEVSVSPNNPPPEEVVKE